MYMFTPNENISDFISKDLFLSISGAMQPGVPGMIFEYKESLTN